MPRESTRLVRVYLQLILVQCSYLHPFRFINLLLLLEHSRRRIAKVSMDCHCRRYNNTTYTRCASLSLIQQYITRGMYRKIRERLCKRVQSEKRIERETAFVSSSVTIDAVCTWGQWKWPWRDGCSWRTNRGSRVRARSAVAPVKSRNLIPRFLTSLVLLFSDDQPATDHLAYRISSSLRRLFVRSAFCNWQAS